MIFRKPYAFIIKNFKIINFILCLLLVFIVRKLFTINSMFNGIYRGSSVLAYNFKFGFFFFLILFLLVVVLFIITFLLFRKKKPFYDYLFGLLYLIIIFFYSILVLNFYDKLTSMVVEITTIKSYSDISFVVILPIFYFLLKYFLSSIGFNVKKFNFSKDIHELNIDKTDDEEVELIFNKNSYKYKRGIRKKLREFKYYFFENKIIIFVILGIVIVSIIYNVFQNTVLDDSSVGFNTQFVIDGIKIKCLNLYETKYDLNNNVIDKNNKFVILKVAFSSEEQYKKFDFTNIRLIFKDSEVYPSVSYKSQFKDLGTLYNNEVVSNLKNFIFVFKVPLSYNSRSYSVMFNAGNSFKSLNAKATDLNKKLLNNYFNKDEKYYLGDNYGDSYIVIKDYDFNNYYSFTFSGKEIFVKENNLNNVVFHLKYELFLDNSNNLNFVNKADFFNKILYIEYYNNDRKVNVGNFKVLDSTLDGDIYLSVPRSVTNYDNLKLLLKLRNKNVYLNF